MVLWAAFDCLQANGRAWKSVVEVPSVLETPSWPSPSHCHLQCSVRQQQLQADAPGSSQRNSLFRPSLPRTSPSSSAVHELAGRPAHTR
jgi:hypothetical protein